ncbi:response regulator transcription factor [Mangrovimonas yunxiaonensis]|uniref:response regulator transcription factor n=1 Tax=Mangrovimonas yunxiaonensis TaxID=1197477 RepID=UPI0037423845
MAQGKKAKDIAKELYISTLTVNTHKRNILKKFHCKNISHLAAVCVKEGLI